MINANKLVWAVVTLTAAVSGLIVILSIWGTGEEAKAITAILGVAAPSLSVLILLLQGQKTSDKIEEVKKEARFVAEVTAENLDNARDSARKAKDAHEKTAKVVESVEEKVAKIDDVANVVQEIKGIVNGQREQMEKRIAELEAQLRIKRNG